MEQFLKRMNIFICARCGGGKLGDHIRPANKDINQYLIPNKNLSLDFYNNYFNDVEHGLFHAVSACYIYWIITKGKIDEKTIASLLLHDFLKCNGFSQEEHDKQLKTFFPNLLEETYTHSNPPDENKLLIKCDRIELRRYSDYKDWVDKRHYELYDMFNEKQKDKIEQFYTKIRPSLEYFYKNRNELFIRHGLEKLEKADINSIFPPENSWGQIRELPHVEDHKKSYPIETDRIPFGYLGQETNRQMGFCSNHGECNNYNNVKGYITYKEFKSNGGKIVNTKIRDHLYATSNMSINKWNFIYQNIDEDNKQKVALEKNNINIISKAILCEFFTFIKLFQDRFVVLNK